ncbi:TetR/AcrR family transcriptional regulator C-terminal domain-containing protein, partial [Streptomyces zhihengii]
SLWGLRRVRLTRWDCSSHIGSVKSERRLTATGRRPAGLKVADAVFGAMVRAGWPPAQATYIGALMRYFITGSALGSFARGFVDDADAYDPADYPHLGQAHLLADRQEQVDEGAFATGLRALLDGLALQYESGARRDGAVSGS